MSAIPELEVALQKGVPIEHIIKQNPEVTTKVGLHLAKTDREKFVQFVLDDLRSREVTLPSLSPVLFTEKTVLHHHAETTTGELVAALRGHNPPVTMATLQNEVGPLNHVSDDGSNVRVSVEGLFVEIKVEKGPYTLLAQVDVATLLAAAGATAITVSVVDKDFYHSNR